MNETLDAWEVTLRLAAAVAAGGALGWERELQEKPAGLRTHMLVALGAAIPILGALQFMALASQESKILESDPFRIIQGIMGGIGFLGAGAIIQSRRWVHGLTTAATIWVSAAIGVICGFGYFAIAGAAVVAALIVLLVFGYLEGRFLEQPEKLDESPADDEPISRKLTRGGSSGASG